MEREISGGAMLGIALLSLAAVIGLGFGVFSITKSLAVDGTVGVQDTLTSISLQTFADYDQRVVTGMQAVSGLRYFEGKPYAVLFKTNSLARGYMVEATHAPYIVEVADSPELTGNTGEVFINYNAVLADEGGNPPDPELEGVGGITSGHLLIYKNNGSYIVKNGVATEDGNIVYDLRLAGVMNPGSAEYISSKAKFNSSILKDESGNYVGLVFEEVDNFN